MKKFILASSSPARKQILETIGANFIVEPSNYEEDMTLPMSPKRLAIFLSYGKAANVAKRHTNSIILGADSFAVFNNQLFGKPHTLKRAFEMLNTLSGKRHSFITGFTIIDTDSKTKYSAAIESKVYFRTISKKEITNYLKKENSLNNAGAYIIQGLGGLLVEKIEGDYFNVMGLPLVTIAKELQNFGINLI